MLHLLSPLLYSSLSEQSRTYLIHAGGFGVCDSMRSSKPALGVHVIRVILSGSGRQARPWETLERH